MATREGAVGPPGPVGERLARFATILIIAPVALFIAFLLWSEGWLVPAEVSCSLPAEQCPISSQYQMAWTNSGEYARPESFTFAEPPVVLADGRRWWQVATSV